MKTFLPHIIIFILIGGIIGCSVLKPKTPQQNYDLAKHYQADGDYVLAERYLTNAITKKSDWLEAYLLRAEINIQRDSFARAIADYTIILNMTSLNAQKKKAEILNLRGSIYHANLQDSLACKDWDNACENFGYTSSCTNKRKYCKK